MRREIRKFFCRKSTIVFFYITIISFCVLTVHRTNQVTRTNDLSFYLNDYNNKEQLIKGYEELKTSFEEENKAEYEAMGLELQPIYDRLAVFEYVIEHYMESSEGVLYSETYADTSRDSLCVMMTMNESIYVIMLLVMAFFSIVVFSADFTEKRHRFLYAGQRRMSILGAKFITYLFLSALVYVGLQVLGGVYTFIFSEHIKKVLFVSNGRVVGVPVLVVWLLEIGSLFVCLLPYMLAFFFFGVMVRNETIAGILDALFFVTIRMIATSAERAPLSVLGNQPLYSIAFGDATALEWGTAYGFLLGVIWLLTLVSIGVFRRANLA